MHCWPFRRRDRLSIGNAARAAGTIGPIAMTRAAAGRLRASAGAGGARACPDARRPAAGDGNARALAQVCPDHRRVGDTKTLEALDPEARVGDGHGMRSIARVPARWRSPATSAPGQASTSAPQRMADPGSTSTGPCARWAGRLAIARLIRTERAMRPRSTGTFETIRGACARSSAPRGAGPTSNACRGTRTAAGPIRRRLAASVHARRSGRGPAKASPAPVRAGAMRFGPARSCFAPSPGGAGSRPGRASNPYRGRPALMAGTGRCAEAPRPGA